MTAEVGACYQLVDRDADEHGAVVDVFEATEHVTSPWGPQMQHGGPVAGLLSRALERHGPRDGTRLSRITVDLLGPVPVGMVRTSTVTRRPGRRIELVEANLETLGASGDWRPAARAQGWRLATQTTDDVVHQAEPSLALPGPEDGADLPFLPTGWPLGGFVDALEFRGFSHGTAPGVPTTVWLRMAGVLVEGETTTPLQQALAISDVANGIGARLDPFVFVFLNTEMTVHLPVPPRGPWFAIQAETTVGPDGIAMSTGILHDPTGPLGRITQNVLVERRPQPDEA